jgi:hypothetical protein
LEFGAEFELAAGLLRSDSSCPVHTKYTGALLEEYRSIASNIVWYSKSKDI